MIIYLELSKNYTISGNVKLNVESSYMDTLANIDEYKPYVNLINNLGKIDSEFLFQQNLDSKKVLGRVSSKLNNEEFDLIITSPLKRAMHTAQIINATKIFR